jgi:hypothetical protein
MNQQTQNPCGAPGNWGRGSRRNHPCERHAYPTLSPFARQQFLRWQAQAERVGNREFAGYCAWLLDGTR